MAIDTAQKRRSALGIGQPWMVVPPAPDGSVSTQADRQHLAFSYSGILAGPLYVAPTDAPAERTMLVAPEARLCSVDAEARAAVVGAETRNVIV